jgi:hypothetical protein
MDGEQLRAWYKRLGWYDSGVKSEEGRAVLIRFSPNFVENPFNPDDEQEIGQGGDTDDESATARRRVPASHKNSTRGFSENMAGAWI